MRLWRSLLFVVGVCAASVLAVALLLPFLAPSLSYGIRDRAAEFFSGQRGRTYRIALGTAGGSYYQIGTVLNRYLKEKAGYELELVATAGVPENVGALLDPARQIDLATIESSSDEAARAQGLYGLAAVGQQYFFVVVPDESPIKDVRDVGAAVNPGLRSEGQAPTLGEKVLEYYGLMGPSATPAEGRDAVSIVRPKHGSVLQDFEAGHMQVATRTQFLHSDLVDGILRNGRYRLVGIRDHEALARALPGTQPGFIPAGAYGPARRIPAEPVPTLQVTTLLVARSDLPGRVAQDVLDAVYDPRFARDIQHELSEQSGQKIGALPLHPAASIYYHRNDLLTSDRLGRLSFVVTIIGGLVAASQFVLHYRRSERRAARRRLLTTELAKLRAIRQRVEDCTNEQEARRLVAEADDLLFAAEQDAASDLLDGEGIQSVRSLHGICWRALQNRSASALHASRVVPPSIDEAAPPG